MLVGASGFPRVPPRPPFPRQRIFVGCRTCTQSTEGAPWGPPYRATIAARTRLCVCTSPPPPPKSNHGSHAFQRLASDDGPTRVPLPRSPLRSPSPPPPRGCALGRATDEQRGRALCQR